MGVGGRRTAADSDKLVNPFIHFDFSVVSSRSDAGYGRGGW